MPSTFATVPIYWHRRLFLRQSSCRAALSCAAPPSWGRTAQHPSESGGDMRSGTSFTQGLRHSVDNNQANGPAWTVEAVRQVRYHVVSSDHLFALDNTALLDACPDAPLRSGDRRLVVVDENVDALYGAQ